MFESVLANERARFQTPETLIRKDRAGRRLNQSGSQQLAMPKGFKLGESQVSEILTAILTRPQATYEVIAAEHGLHKDTVRWVATRHNIHRTRGRKKAVSRG